ncbi:hypothetical protein CD351_05445 [Erythrobacter sp. KY5]|uniref:hypothetical protein n=1 Tax=Erythrobacter sp. KY5 TaxID=2011159 RepID=UPI000DBF2951|nr:hypothetical protein [Erythrobacter sp. KY5]AWW73867.1 hypothetical protein CD351_05445 [Erythrobacter sp. KY5]
MVSGGPLLLAAVVCLFLLASAFWAERRFAGYDRLPRQFGFTLKAIAYGPRWVIIWFVPLIIIAAIALAVFAPAIFPSENIRGEPGTGVVIASLVGAAAQVFILWLLVRWANGQG